MRRVVWTGGLGRDPVTPAAGVNIAVMLYMCGGPIPRAHHNLGPLAATVTLTQVSPAGRRTLCDAAPPHVPVIALKPQFEQNIGSQATPISIR